MADVDTVLIYVIVGVIVLLGAIAYGVSLIAGRRGTLEREAAPARPGLPTEDLDRQPPGDTTGTADTVAPPEHPGAPATVEVEPEPEVAPAPPQPTVERPASARGRLQRLRARLARSNSSIGQGLLALLSRGKLDEETWEEVEDTLISSDLGVEASMELVESLRTRVKVDGATDEATVRGWLREDLLSLVQPDMDRRITSTRVGDRPAVILVVGVNGTGKTTTVGKLARVLVAEDREVLLGAADTFRAAAADQLETWGARVGVPTVRSDKDGADPAAVAFDAVKAGIEEEVDVVIIDTAGRLHNKVGLMDELGKVKRVIEKQSEIDEVLLVLDATTGQNGLQQAKVFSEAVDVTGIVLTKLDGTAKGGIVVAVQRQLGVPVKLVGLGEGPDDLAPFDPEAFVDAIVN
ncbi:signal recognition particle-docking protein FtsY [Terrabacter sp. BE26]|uniref:signal recognition particle-docking protein FtsY n=1 Tax=Terrabacter sp. BE26 TaxID=2898152 RepID=UPI0035BE6A4B